ncbi:MAG TPA: alpha/beta hydrolase [Tepidisphaeraceae bacterium]|jgi:acetyl esterase/lipase|nr:alpha/beta hydrolase [Tepidisphaeraceae bacterium]
MRRRTPILLLTILLCLIAAPITRGDDAKPAPNGLPPGVKLIPNIEYANVNGKSLLLDLYLPEKAGKPVPVIMYVHGGGWVSGDKHEAFIGSLLVPKGYAIASINYRFSNEAVFPAQLHDCKAAVRWLRAHARYYGLDSNHIGAWGASAGGHLVALLGTTGDVKNLEGDEGNLDQSSRVQAVCDWFGPTDFLKIEEEAKTGDVKNALNADAPDSLVSRLIGGPIQKEKEKTEKANPIVYVDKNSAPTLIMHGDKDNLVPLAQSEIFRDALKNAGVDVKLDVIKGAGHGFFSPEIFKTVEDFFDAHLKQKGAGKA